MANRDEDGAESQLIADQIAYYRRRAPEYDATSSPTDDPLESEAQRIAVALRAQPRVGEALELAAGTGTWTNHLLQIAERVVAVDAAPEMLELNRLKLASPRVEYVVADVFAYEPPRRFDMVFFGFWLSHVPPGRFASFWELVRRSLTPAGRVFFVDEARGTRLREDWLDREKGVVRRVLEDGSEHRAVKVLWEPPELAAALRALGWRIEVNGTGSFYWGTGGSH